MSSESIPYTLPLAGGIPDTVRPHTERTTTILVPKSNTAFLNPVQEYNRDTSVAVIRAWNEQRKEELEAKWRRSQSKGKKKAPTVKPDEKEEEAQVNAEEEVANAEAGPSSEREFRARKITILEALSATGLRSIRYAKEIPDVKTVLANDLSPSACDAMRTNVELNGVGEGQQPVEGDHDLGRREGCEGVVKVNEGDACSLMYSHRAPKDRVDVVDLDPYGTAAPFIDAAVGCIADRGLLAITCTDLAVLAGSNYPEKAFSNYGGVCVNAEYSKEVALRLVLNSLAQAAARYGRYITPLISLSIDFYVRLFVRIDTRPVEVKQLFSQTGLIYACSYCQTPVEQRFGRVTERKSQKGDHTNLVYRSAMATATSAGCEECGSPQHVAGPMWMGPLHDPEFVSRVLTSIEVDKEYYGTWPRMNGMLSIAQQELVDPFYFTSSRVCKSAHASTIPTKIVISALLNAGYKVSRSHAEAGSVKTDAPRSFVYDMVREWIKTNPVRLDKMSENSPSRVLVAKPMTHTVDLTLHSDAATYLEKGTKVHYQMNPLPNWGPAARARSVKVDQEQGKRKNEEEEVAAEPKRAKIEEEEEAAMNA